MRPSTRVAALAALTSVVAHGCGDSGDAPGRLTLYPVKGKVLLDDGKPLTAGRVVFVATQGTLAPNGPVGADGSFTLTSGPAGEGAPAGEYKVRVEPATPSAKSSRGAKPPFANRFADEDASGLMATVAAGPNDLPPFKLSDRGAALARASADPR